MTSIHEEFCEEPKKHEPEPKEPKEPVVHPDGIDPGAPPPLPPVH